MAEDLYEDDGIVVSECANPQGAAHATRIEITGPGGFGTITSITAADAIAGQLVKWASKRRQKWAARGK